MFNREDFSSYLERQLESAKDRITKFRSELGDYPCMALPWSQDAFEAGARIRVYTEVLTYLKSDATLEEIQAYVTKSVISGAKFPKFSTSPTTNLFEQYVTASWAEVAEALGIGKQYGLRPGTRGPDRFIDHISDIRYTMDRPAGLEP